MPDAPAIETIDDVLIPFEGETIAATRYRPAGADGPLPALLVLTPYRKGDFSTYGSGYDAIVRYLAAHDYEVVVADLLGTGASSGFKAESYSVDEGEQAAAVADWLADRDWTTGRVGAFGKSYRGKTALHAAAESPVLDAIVPIMGPDSPYDHSRYPGGAGSFRHLGGWLARMHTLAALPPARRDAEGRWADVWNERLDGMSESEPWSFAQLDHPTKDDHWKAKDVDLGAIEAPTFIAAGFRDFLQHDPFEQMREIDAPVRVLVGPWRHVMPHKGREAAVDFRAQVVEWFDRFLKDEDNEALEHPPVTFYTERDGGGKIGGGVWRGAESWPTVADDPSGSDDPLEFALAPEGLVRADEFDSGALFVEYEHDHTVGLDSLFYLGRPTDTSADDARSLAVETDPLSRPVELTGTGEVVLRLSSTAADPLLVARLVDVAPDGSARLVTYGPLRVALREGRSTANELVSGEEYSITVPLRPRSHVFEAGHRIRLAVSASFFPWLLPAREHGVYTVRSTPAEPSLLRFPGAVHDEVDFDDTVAVNPPEREPFPPTGAHVIASDGSIERIRETESDTATLRTTDESVLDVPYGTVRTESTVEWSVAADDPTTAVARSDWVMEIEHGTTTVEAEATNRVGHDTAHITETVRIDGGVAYDESWRYERDRKG